MASEDLAAELRRLSDIEAIKQLKAKYTRLVDAKEWDAWGQLFVEDCLLHTDGGPTEGRERVVAGVSRALAEAKTVHRLHTPEISLTGLDSASAIWPMTDYVTGVFNGASMVIRGYGHYHEDYLRTAEGWRVKSSRLIRQRVDVSPGPSEPAAS
jgi:hypothetical protein